MKNAMTIIHLGKTMQISPEVESTTIYLDNEKYCEVFGNMQKQYYIIRDIIKTNNVSEIHINTNGVIGIGFYDQMMSKLNNPPFDL